MIIIELKIFSNHFSLSDVYLEKRNNIVVFNYKKMYTFLNCFFNSQEYNVHIGNYKIDQKSAYIVNLLDYESISNQLLLKKGTLLYDYLIEEVTEKVETTDIKEVMEMKLEQMINEALEDKTIEYETNFSIDINKIIVNYVNFKIDLSIQNYIKIIKKLLYNLKIKNMKKTIIILVNTKIFNDSLDEIENATILKFFSNEFPNILISNEIMNIDKRLLYNQLRLNWPCEISDKLVEELILSFFQDYSVLEVIHTRDYIKYIAYVIMSKLFQIDVKCKLSTTSNEKIPSVYLNYLNQL